MPDINRIKGVKELISKFASMQKIASIGKNEVTVGYTAKYAVFVHENIEMKLKGKSRKGKHPDGRKRKGKYWDPQDKGRAKFLEQPARELSGRMGKQTANAMKNGATLSQALAVAGLLLQRASQLLVPVDLGNLKGSAFTRIGNTVFDETDEAKFL